MQSKESGIGDSARHYDGSSNVLADGIQSYGHENIADITILLSKCGDFSSGNHWIWLLGQVWYTTSYLDQTRVYRNTTVLRINRRRAGNKRRRQIQK